MAKFLRESSGLVKTVTLKDLVMLNIANMGAGLAVFQGISPYIIPGARLWIASILTFLFTLPILFSYTILTTKIPRTGGDYVWLSRKLSPALGSIMGIAFAFNMPPFFALSAFFSGAAINTVLYEIGSLDSVSSLQYLADKVFVNPYVTTGITHLILFYLIAAVSFIIIIIINIIKPRWGYTLTTALGMLSVGTLILAMLVVGISLPYFHSAVEPLLSIYGISPMVYKGPRFSLYSTVYMVPYFASYAYIWLYAGPAVSAEAKQGSLKYNLIISSVMTLFLITTPFLLLDIGGGYGFNYNLYLTGNYNFWTIAIALAKNPILQWILGIGLIAWNFFIMAFGVIVFSRYIFAFAFDRLFPASFAKLNKASSPIYAHLLDLGVTLFFLAIPVISIYGAESLYSYTPLAVTYLILLSIVAIKVGRVEDHKPLFWSGIISLFTLGLLGYESFTNPYFGIVSSSGINLIGVGYLLGLIGLGCVTYTVARTVRRREGIELSQIYTEIPPE
ncbi:amino acid permease [Sulfolobales archaeon HS-7]|nr:amino acid permease [Sulfolobales archaeon HS-7]